MYVDRFSSLERNRAKSFSSSSKPKEQQQQKNSISKGDSSSAKSLSFQAQPEEQFQPVDLKDDSSSAKSLYFQAQSENQLQQQDSHNSFSRPRAESAPNVYKSRYSSPKSLEQKELQVKKSKSRRSDDRSSIPSILQIFSNITSSVLSISSEENSGGNFQFSRSMAKSEPQQQKHNLSPQQNLINLMFKEQFVDISDIELPPMSQEEEDLAVKMIKFLNSKKGEANENTSAVDLLQNNDDIKKEMYKIYRPEENFKVETVVTTNDTETEITYNNKTIKLDDSEVEVLKTICDGEYKPGSLFHLIGYRDCLETCQVKFSMVHPTITFLISFYKFVNNKFFTPDIKEVMSNSNGLLLKERIMQTYNDNYTALNEPGKKYTLLQKLYNHFGGTLNIRTASMSRNSLL